MSARNCRPLPHLKWNWIVAFSKKTEIELSSSVFNLTSLYTFNLTWTDKLVFTRWENTENWFCNCRNTSCFINESRLMGKLYNFFPFHFLKIVIVQTFFSFKRRKKKPVLFTEKAELFYLLNTVFGDPALSLFLFGKEMSDRCQRSAIECQNVTGERTGTNVCRYALFTGYVAQTTHRVFPLLYIAKKSFTGISNCMKPYEVWHLKHCDTKFKSQFWWSLKKNNPQKQHIKVWCFCRIVTWHLYIY